MWIRSQDRLRLLDIKAIYACANNPTEIEGVIANTIDDIGFPLGTYKTEARALEVLDEIQEIVQGFRYDEVTDGVGVWDKRTEIDRSTVYEMPKEWLNVRLC